MRILIIEDESRIAKRIKRMITEIFGQDLRSIDEANTLELGLKKIKEQSIDLLFLDLNLNGLDGFQVLESVVSESFHTIIISAYKEKAIKAFEYGVLDFVPKPFDIDRLTKACQRMKNQSNSDETLKFLAVKKKGKRKLLKIEDVLYIKGAGIYTEIFLRNGDKEIHNKSLDSLGLILPDHFERIHKSYLVSMKEAANVVIEPGSKYGLKINNQDILPIGRTRYKDLVSKWFS